MSSLLRNGLGLVSVLLLLAGCGGGSTSNVDMGSLDDGMQGSGQGGNQGGGQGGNPGGTNPNFAAPDATAAALISHYVTSNGTPVGGLERSQTFTQQSSANYTGALRGDLGGGGIVGDLSINIAFSNGETTGTLSNVEHETNGSYSGSATGTGTFDPNADTILPQITMVLRGNLENGGADLDTAIALDGDFYAANADPEGALGGAAEGSIGTQSLISGVFAAEK